MPDETGSEKVNSMAPVGFGNVVGRSRKIGKGFSPVVNEVAY